MIIYLRILERLSDAGYSAYRIKKEKLLPGGTIDRLRSGRTVTTDTLDVICRLLSCQPGDLLAWVPGEEGEQV